MEDRIAELEGAYHNVLLTLLYSPLAIGFGALIGTMLRSGIGTQSLILGVSFLAAGAAGSCVMFLAMGILFTK